MTYSFPAGGTSLLLTTTEYPDWPLLMMVLMALYGLISSALLGASRMGWVGRNGVPASMHVSRKMSSEMFGAPTNLDRSATHFSRRMKLNCRDSKSQDVMILAHSKMRMSDDPAMA